MFEGNAQVVGDLVQVRDALRLVDSALMLEEATSGRKLLGDRNTVRDELSLLCSVIARLSGEAVLPPPGQ